MGANDCSKRRVVVNEPEDCSSRYQTPPCVLCNKDRKQLSLANQLLLSFCTPPFSPAGWHMVSKHQSLEGFCVVWHRSMSYPMAVVLTSTVGEYEKWAATFLGLASTKHSSARLMTSLRFSSSTTEGRLLATQEMSCIASCEHLPKVWPAAYSSLPFKVSSSESATVSDKCFGSSSSLGREGRSLEERWT